MREGALGAPFELIARRLGDYERLRTPRTAVAIHALFDGIVEHGSLRYGAC